ncbi:hypothetical protein [Streptomyces apocyni]|uniref:hypothetical protein n=1 Tax=Streptomyces apocyni TaxID=2654677 RepID=UPI0012EAB86B|nr:hypothetical protein [Streptomyces apocyni]
MDSDRSLIALGLHTAPLSDPLAYPGTAPGNCGLLVRDHYARVVPVRGQPLGQWWVEQSAADGPRRVPLDHVLLRHDRCVADARVPVLAVGSNASPAQLHHKFTRLGVLGAVPMIRAAVTGIGPGVSAHIGRAGYVPAAPVLTTGDATTLVVSWLTGAQLAALDSTERHYDRVVLPGARFPVELPSGERLGGCQVYVGKYGCLLADDSAPQALLPQRELLRLLLERSAALRMLLGRTPEAAVARAAADATVREAARRIFAAEGWVARQPELEALAATAMP